MLGGTSNQKLPHRQDLKHSLQTGASPRRPASYRQSPLFGAMRSRAVHAPASRSWPRWLHCAYSGSQPSLTCTGDPGSRWLWFWGGGLHVPRVRDLPRLHASFVPTFDTLERL